MMRCAPIIAAPGFSRLAAETEHECLLSLPAIPSTIAAWKLQLGSAEPNGQRQHQYEWARADRSTGGHRPRGLWCGKETGSRL